MSEVWRKMQIFLSQGFLPLLGGRGSWTSRAPLMFAVLILFRMAGKRLRDQNEGGVSTLCGSDHPVCVATDSWGGRGDHILM